MHILKTPKAGAQLIDMEHVQLHPTGLVDPNKPSALSKILGPETLRGVGGVLLLKTGERFVNELARRGHVTAEIRAKGDVFGDLESGREQRTASIVLNTQV
jgi:succinate dehydrogenase/fumarate reductase flavoprotein subunit